MKNCIYTKVELRAEVMKNINIATDKNNYGLGSYKQLYIAQQEKLQGYA